MYAHQTLNKTYCILFHSMTTDTDLPAIHTQNDQQHFVVKTTIEELNLIIFLVNLQDPLGGFHSTSVSIFDRN